MEFNDLRSGIYVKYNNLLSKIAHEFPDAARWYEEPVNCLLFVEKAEENEIVLSCPNDCGQHSVQVISKEEYQEYSNIVRGSFLNISNVSEHIGSGLNADVEVGPQVEFDSACIDAGPFDVDKEVENILQFLESKVQGKKSQS